MQQDTQDVQNFFGRARAAGKHDDAVAGAHEGFQTLFDIRQDHQIVDDRIRRFGRDDAGFGYAEILAVLDPLLGMADRRAFHRAFHRARPAAGADIQAAQAHFMADRLAVIVFLTADRVPAPAHHQIRVDHRAQNLGVAQDVKYGAADAVRGVQIEHRIIVDLVADVNNVAQHRKQMLIDAFDHFAVNKGMRGSDFHLQLDAALFLNDAYFKIGIAFQQFLAVIHRAAAIQYRQRAIAEQPVQPALAGIEQFADFGLGQYIQTAFRSDACVNYLSVSLCSFGYVGGDYRLYLLVIILIHSAFSDLPIFFSLG